MPHVLLSGPPFTGGYSEPEDINDDGVIVGIAAPPDGSTYAVKWVPSVTATGTRTGEWDAAVPLDPVAAASPGGANAIVGPRRSLASLEVPSAAIPSVIRAAGF